MPKKTNADTALNTLLKDNENFASVFNAFFFDGQQIVRPEDLHELDSRAAAEVGVDLAIQKTADVAKLWTNGDTVQILVIENQTYIDYGMVVREIGERAAFLGEEREKIMRKNRAAGLLDSRTLLSGMRKEDKVIPVRILTIYYGEEPWDAPINPKDAYVPNTDMGPRYNENGVTLLEVRNEHLQGLTPAVEHLFSLLQARYTPSGTAFVERLVHYLANHDVDTETMKAFSRIIGNKGVLSIYREVMQEKEKGGLDMSLSVEHWVREWVEDLHPEWIRAVEEKQRELNKKDKDLDQLASEKKQVASKYNWLAHEVAIEIIKADRTAGVPGEATIRKIMRKTKVSEEMARRFLAECQDHSED